MCVCVCVYVCVCVCGIFVLARCTYHSSTSSPGPVDPTETTIADSRKVVIVQVGVYHRMLMTPKDAFGNHANIIVGKLSVEIRKVKEHCHV